MAEMIWTAKQDAALKSVSAWLRNPGGRPVYRLFGYAGTGKTTLARHFAEGLDGVTQFAAFTGKAAHVLQQKGCTNATTIHKLIYKPKEKSRMRLNDLIEDREEILQKLIADGITNPEEQLKNAAYAEVITAIAAEMKFLRQPCFALNTEDSPLLTAKLLVIDECSMVDDRIGHDLLEFKVPILVLGDPGQLPPVRGEGFFTKVAPDTLLTEIRRQEADNPIIQMATRIRQNQELRHGAYGSSKVIDKSQIDRAELMAYDQVLVGTNKSRKNFNHRIRQLSGRGDPLPMEGDRLVCLRNNHDLGLLNGSIWKVHSKAQLDPDSIELDLSALDSERGVVVSAHTAYFKGEEPAFYEIKDHECFDYGNALTVHKSQGSQWDKVYIFDESRFFGKDASKHLYTALTRAAKEVTVVI